MKKKEKESSILSDETLFKGYFEALISRRVWQMSSEAELADSCVAEHRKRFPKYKKDPPPAR